MRRWKRLKNNLFWFSVYVAFAIAAWVTRIMEYAEHADFLDFIKDSAKAMKV